MDIQAIIKQVLSLADLVIKNPSTSVKSSGIDLSSLAQMAGGLLGGSKSGQQSSGGSALGSILGGVVASGALGGLLGGGSNQQQQQQQSSTGSALGSILGSAISSGALGGLLGGGSQQQQSSGGLGDLLGQLTSRAGTITNMLNGSNSSNLSSDQKTNLGDVLNIVNIAKGFIK
ncbi:MAG: hypothetical protein K5685_00770 [Bacteroidales bacterium]|nr:hypothetical protein [Bacteroidales bacterium]